MNSESGQMQQVNVKVAVRVKVDKICNKQKWKMD